MGIEEIRVITLRAINKQNGRDGYKGIIYSRAISYNRPPKCYTLNLDTSSVSFCELSFAVMQCPITSLAFSTTTDVFCAMFDVPVAPSLVV